jgi:hypothetical protein
VKKELPTFCSCKSLNEKEANLKLIVNLYRYLLSSQDDEIYMENPSVSDPHSIGFLDPCGSGSRRCKISEKSEKKTEQKERKFIIKS